MASVPLLVPDLGRVDGAIVLTAWLAGEGEEVVAGGEFAEVETSKVTFALESPATGSLARLVEQGAEVAVGQTIGRLD